MSPIEVHVLVHAGEDRFAFEIHIVEILALQTVLAGLAVGGRQQFRRNGDQVLRHAAASSEQDFDLISAETAQSCEGINRSLGRHIRASAARAMCIRVWADDGDGLDFAAVERQCVAVILQQYDSFLGETLCQCAMLRRVNSATPRGFRIIEKAGEEGDPENAAHLVVDQVFRHFAVPHGLQKIFAEIPARAGHFEVEATEREVRGAVYRAPVGNHESLEPEFFLEQFIQQVVVRAAVNSAQPVVGAHYGPRLGFFDNHFKVGEINLA